MLYGSALNILARKSDKSFSSKLKLIIETISDDAEVAQAVGSATYKSISKNASDIDIFEPMDAFASTKEAALKTLAKHIQKIVARVKSKKDFFFSEFKAGINSEYLIPAIGSFNYHTNRLIGYNHAKVKAKLLALMRKKFLSPYDFEELMDFNDKIKSVSKSHKIKYYENFDKIIREYQILRWTQDEVLRGYKMLPGNKKRTLASCLDDKTVCKIDVVTWIENRYVEATNLFVLIWTDRNGRKHYLNIEGNNLEKYLDKGIRKEIAKLSNPESSNFNCLKLAKRMWTLGSFMNDDATLKKLLPLLNSGIGELNKVKGDCEVIINMLTKLKKVPYEKILNEIDGFKSRLGNVNMEQLDNAVVDQLVDSIVHAGGHNSRENVKEQLDILMSYLSKIIKEVSYKYMKSKKLFPPPRKYL